MLFLILADRHVIRLIEQNICRHKRWICEQTEIHVLGCFLTLFLELSHTACLAELRVAIEHPRKFCVLRHLRLHEKNRLLRIESYCEKQRHKVVSATAKIRRDVIDGDCVHIGNRINALILVLQFDHIFERADIVAELQITRRLQCAIHYFLFLFFHNNHFISSIHTHKTAFCAIYTLSTVFISLFRSLYRERFVLVDLRL